MMEDLGEKKEITDDFVIAGYQNNLIASPSSSFYNMH